MSQDIEDGRIPSWDSAVRAFCTGGGSNDPVTREVNRGESAIWGTFRP
jgi:hypothetical protein